MQELSRNNMRITAKTLTGDSISLEVDKGDTIGNIKDVLCATHNYDRDLRIVVKGQMPDDTATLESLGMEDGDVLHIILRLRGD